MLLDPPELPTGSFWNNTQEKFYGCYLTVNQFNSNYIGCSRIRSVAPDAFWQWINLTLSSRIRSVAPGKKSVAPGDSNSPQDSMNTDLPQWIIGSWVMMMMDDGWWMMDDGWHSWTKYLLWDLSTQSQSWMMMIIDDDQVIIDDDWRWMMIRLCDRSITDDTGATDLPLLFF